MPSLYIHLDLLPYEIPIIINLVEAHCYGIRKGSGHVLSNHVAVNG